MLQLVAVQVPCDCNFAHILSEHSFATPGHRSPMAIVLTYFKCVDCNAKHVLAGRTCTVLCTLCCAVLCCAVLCCAVLRCAALSCSVLCCAVLCCAVLCCAVLCCAVLCCAGPVVCCQQPSKLKLLPLMFCGNRTFSDCAILQSQEQTLLLEPSNAYWRAIQYQQLEKLQKADRGNQGFYVQVCNSTIMVQQACRVSSSV